MKSPYEEIFDKWSIEEPIYNELGTEVKSVLKDLVYENGMYADVSYRTKDIISVLKKLKSKNENKDYKFEDLTDKLGLRIICNYKEDLISINEIIHANFSVIKFEDKAEKLPHDVFSYTSYHYDLKWDKCSDKTKQNLIFELQLRTINQHAWACTAHELSYKQEIELPNSLKRKVHRLVALYEIADDELSSVNNFVSNHTDFPIFTLFKKLEKYFYKLAKHSFDRQESIRCLKILITFLSVEELLDFNNSFDNFITKNSLKISEIFSEYKTNPSYNFIILQPEILMIWFILSNYEYSLSDNWNNHFETNDLEVIRIVWGELE